MTLFCRPLIFFLLQVMLSPFALADTIYFKDGSITVCRDRAWEEGETVKCEFYGTAVSYPLGEVDRIETGQGGIQGTVTGPAEEGAGPPGTESAQAVSRSARAPLPEIAGGASSGPLFYDPRRTHKYWASETSRHDSFNGAIDALARKFDRTPEWIKAHMSATNDLTAIHRNLSPSPQVASIPDKTPPAPDRPDITDIKGLKGLKFYDPRRSDKYWISKTSHHTSLNGAIGMLARQYGRPPEWVKSHMGGTNELDAIHRNLLQVLAKEESR